MQAQIPAISPSERIADFLRPHIYTLQTPVDLDSMLDGIGDARIVMLGEASHGTHEFYTWRAMISQRLIREKGFSFIAVEGDWPDCFKINRYVKNHPEAGRGAFDVLQSFNRWPTWMWANWETVALAEWLYDHNNHLPGNRKAGFYGLDVYSLWESMEAIIQYLQKTDPAALVIAREAFQCFQPYQRDEGTGYAYASLLVPEPCTREVASLLAEIRRKMLYYDGDQENVLSTEQNAQIALHAERYYRAMLQGGSEAWNIRDNHMMDTLDKLLQFHGRRSKAIVWAHNTHIGDARATDMVSGGMHNLGELARQKFGDKAVFLAGFGSYEGSVIASPRWGEKLQYMLVPPAIESSWEDILHHTATQSGYLFLHDFAHKGIMDHVIGHRAIGVVYHPDQERYGNYVPTVLPERYDAFVFFEKTKALHPLHVQPDGNQMPETYPFGV